MESSHTKTQRHEVKVLYSNAPIRRGDATWTEGGTPTLRDPAYPNLLRIQWPEWQRAEVDFESIAPELE
jgi:hypothetical protein